jgi:CRISPR-associated endonuclease/helicase Cas3
MAAKTDPKYGEGWLPLWMHLYDTAGVISKLTDHWLPQSTINAIGLSHEDLKKTSVFLAAIHDIGKATPLFQSKITMMMPGIREKLADAEVRLFDLHFFQDASKSPHALAGEVILNSFGCPVGISSIVGAHHGKPQGISESPEDQTEIYWTNYYGPEDDKIWKDIWSEWIDFALAVSGFSSLDELPELSLPSQMIFSGLLITADWIASNTTYFPLISRDSTGERSCYPGRVDIAMKILDFPELWIPKNAFIDSKCFNEEFGFFPCNVQKAAINIANDMCRPGVMIIEAQMGVGKTEAALAAAEIIAAKTGSGGFFFGLPTQATANGIFPRLEKWAEHQSEDAVHSIRLAHGAAELNDDYRRLFCGSSEVSEDDPKSGLTVHNWFEGRKQALLADFVIATVDQILLAALRQKHVMLRHLGLAGKVVIVDECHAYDAYMNQYLYMALTWLGAYGVPVILLSATLPVKRRKELISAYLGNENKHDVEMSEKTDSHDYPLITWSDEGRVFQAPIKEDCERRKVEVEYLPEGKISDFLKDKLSGGGCACVILNTVSRAQHFAAVLKERMSDFDVLLIHSRYVMTDRAEIEKIIMRRMGKKSLPEQRDKLIIVGTQILEQSLDYDCDIMITDLCPIDLLLQRIGRLHRHKRFRPEKLTQACCMILETPDGQPEKGSVAIYTDWLLLMTKENVKKEILLPDDIPLLVNRVYENDIEPKDEMLKKAKEKYLEKQEKLKRKAVNFRLNSPPLSDGTLSSRSLDGWLDNGLNLGDQSAEATVRDTEASIEVLVMMRDNNGHIHFLPWQNGGAEVPYDIVPSDEEARQIARQRIRLPPVICRKDNIDLTIRELESINKSSLAEWQKSHFLKGELILLLDEKQSARIGGYKLIYSKENGLDCDKEDDDENDRI